MLAVLIAVSSALALATPAGLSAPASAAALTPCPLEGSPAYVATAEALVAANQKDRAEQIYQAVIFRDPQQECAVRGLAALTQRRSAERSDLGRLGDSWDRSFTKYVAPALAPAVGLVAIVAVLTAVASLLAGALTPFGARSRGRKRRSTAEAIGLVALCLGSLCLVAAAGVISAGSVGWTALADAAASWPLSLSLFWSLFLAGLALALVGVVGYAAALGRELKLALDVRGGKGETDVVAAQYLLARLTQLGSQAPTGLRTSEHTDVTGLPESAVSILQVSGVSRVLVWLLRTVRRPAPWRATVGLPDSSTVVVTLTRNGKAVPNWTTTVRQLGLSAGSSDGTADTGTTGLIGPAVPEAARRHLLTAAAAYVLLEISRVDDVLRRGLCGATSARSIAMQLITDDPSERLPDPLATTLLRRAVATDPGNGLALVALLGRRSFDRDQQEGVAADADAALDRITERGAGYAAMRLRLAYILTATRFNALLLSRQTGEADAQLYTAQVGVANAAAGLVRLLRSSAREAAELRRQMRVTVGYLVLDVNASLGDGFELDGWSRAVDAAQDWVRHTRTSDSVTVPPPLNAQESYARACYECSRQATSDWERRALADLQVAVTDPALREWARADPSLEPLRREPDDADCGPNDTVAEDFQRVVGDPPVSSFFDLAVFEPRRAELRALALQGPQDLLDLTPRELSRLDLPEVVARRWAGIARLALPADDRHGVPLGLLDVIVGLGVASRGDLQSRIEADLDGWHRRVLAAARAIAIRPRKVDWAGYGGHRALSRL